MDEPVLLCDFGGTHARLGVLQDGKILHKKKLKCAEFESHAALFQHYQEQKGVTCHSIAVAAAGAHFDRSTYSSGFTENSKISEVYLEKSGFSQSIILNDFEASAYGTINYHFQKNEILHGGRTDLGEPVKCLIGPGTGIGCAFIHTLPERAYIHTVPNGGHIYPCAVTDEQHDLLKALQASQELALIYEDLACGRGLQKLYQYFTGQELDHPQQIFAASKDPLHAKILRLFHEFLGVFLAHNVTTANAFGGVILHGGLVDYLTEAGVFDFAAIHNMMLLNITPNILQQLKNTPVYYINDTYLALYGLKYVMERNHA